MLSRTHWATGALAIAVCCCVLSFYRATDGAQRSTGPAKQPFASAIEQRMETINELKGIRELLREQNRLLKEQNEMLRSTLPNPPQPKKR